MSFKVGEKCVCVDGFERKDLGKALIKNEIYTCMGKNPINGKMQVLELGKAGNGLYYSAHWWRFKKIDYNFVEEVIQQVRPKTVEI